MRTARSALPWLVCLLLGAGCYESLSSIVTPDKLVYFDDLAGDYTIADPGEGRVTLAKGKDKAYDYKQFDPQGVIVNKGTLRIVKLGDAYFYELTFDDFKTDDDKSLYLIGRLVIEGKDGARSLQGYGFKEKEMLFDGPDVTTAEYTYDRGGEKQKGRTLSMPTDRLQAYFAAHAKEMNEPMLRFERVKSAGK